MNLPRHFTRNEGRYLCLAFALAIGGILLAGYWSTKNRTACVQDGKPGVRIGANPCTPCENDHKSFTSFRFCTKSTMFGLFPGRTQAEADENRRLGRGWLVPTDGKAVFKVDGYLAVGESETRWQGCKPMPHPPSYEAPVTLVTATVEDGVLTMRAGHESSSAQVRDGKAHQQIRFSR